MIRPNGIQLSRDEKTLYVSDSNGIDVIAWDIQPDGLVRNRVEVLRRQGQHLGTIPVRCPPADCQNVAFIGPEKRTLYIASAGFLYKVAMVARGFTGRAK